MMATIDYNRNNRNNVDYIVPGDMMLRKGGEKDGIDSRSRNDNDGDDQPDDNNRQRCLHKNPTDPVLNNIADEDEDGGMDYTGVYSDNNFDNSRNCFPLGRRNIVDTDNIVHYNRSYTFKLTHFWCTTNITTTTTKVR